MKHILYRETHRHRHCRADKQDALVVAWVTPPLPRCDTHLQLRSRASLLLAHMLTSAHRPRGLHALPGAIMCGAASRTCTTTTSRDASPHHAAPLARRPSASALRLAFVDIRVEVFCDLQLPCWHGADARDLHRLTCRIAPRLLRATIIMPGACSWRQLKVIRRRPLDHGSPDGSVPDEVRGGHHEYSSSAPDIAFFGGGMAGAGGRARAGRRRALFALR